MKNIKGLVVVLVVILVVSAGMFLWSNKQHGGLSRLPFLGRGIYNTAEVNKVRERGVLRVGFDATYYPMEYLNEKNEIDGYDVDLAREIANEIGVPLEMKNIAFDSLFSELNAGRVDLVISSITITPERARLMEFSKPYFNAGQAIVVLKGSSSIKSSVSLKGKKLGVQSGTTSEIEAAKLTDPKLVSKFADYDVATVKLISGDIDALIMDYPAAVGKARGDSRLEVAGRPFTQEFYGVVVAKGNSGLLQPVDAVITSLSVTGGQRRLETKWLE